MATSPPTFVVEVHSPKHSMWPGSQEVAVSRHEEGLRGPSKTFKRQEHEQ